MSRFSVHDNNVNINDRRPVSSHSLANRGLPVPPSTSPPPAPRHVCGRLRPSLPLSTRFAATCMIFRLGVRTCEPCLRAFIICFYARSLGEGPANTWTARCHPAEIVRSETDASGEREQRGRQRRRGKRGGGEDRAKRNNISPKDLFTWRETLVSQSGSLPRGSFVVVVVDKSISLLRCSIRDVYQKTRTPV